MKRTLLLAIAGLAALAPSAAANHKPNHDGPGNLTIDATPTTVKFGRSVTLSGKLTGQNSDMRPVTVEQDPFPVDTFIEAGATTTNATGDWTFSHSPTVNTRYRARSGGNESQIVTVLVRPAITLRVSDATPRAGQLVRFSGRLCPEHDGTRVALQRRTASGSWRTLRRPLLKDIAGSTCSRFSRALRPRRDGRFRVRFGGDGDHAAAASRVRRVNVS